MKIEIQNLINFYQSELDLKEAQYDPSKQDTWIEVQYLGKLIDSLYDACMYSAWIEELK